MTELSGDLMFDPSKRKKKKKKDADDDIAGDKTESQPVIEDDLGEELNFGKKKKEKKPVEPVETAVDLDAPLEFDKKRKKKKDKNVLAGDLESGDAPLGTEANDGYSYTELLTRAFKIMEERNPEMLSGERKKMVVKPPTLMRVGTRRTAFTNFHEICRQMHRKQEHLLAYLLAELGTSGSVDGNNQIIFKGRFQTKQIENVLRSYIKEYVMCHTCRNYDTELTKDTRLFFLQCSTCGSRCSVQSIKSGFQAQVGKRAAMRAKAT